MKLDFRLLIVDDHPDSVDEACHILSDHLERKGFALKITAAPDLSEKGLKELARQSGKDYDLVIVDYNLGSDEIDGAVAAKKLRHELQYTDMVFYSSDTSLLFNELYKQQVAGIFVAGRTELSEFLVGLSDTVIGKAVDLNHMRGIAMAEVAEMDVLMSETLERAFSDAHFAPQARDTLKKLLVSAEEGIELLRPHVETAAILDVITNGRLFSSAHKFMAIRRIAKVLETKPTEALKVFESYEADIINNRNTLAHAKADEQEDGTVQLRSIKKGQPSVAIDEEWMINFRTKLRTQRSALYAICDAIGVQIVMSEKQLAQNAS